MKGFLCGLIALFCVPGLVQAETSQQAEGLAWLQKASTAAHQLSYTGTFIYQYGSHMETSRITHLRDESGEHEKLETLDGTPRELIRDNEEVVCYTPENKSVVVEKGRARKTFPAILPKQLSGLADNYQIKLGGQERVAGHVCQVLELEPRDNLRYRHKFWAERNSGLLLKAALLNEKGEMVDQVAFTEIAIGGQIDRNQLKPKLAGKRLFHSKDQSLASVLQPDDSSWMVNRLPAGFVQILDMRRMLPGKRVPVRHLVYSDGLTAVSVFIEPLAEMDKPMQGLSAQGAINIYARPVAEYQVTVLGEIPAATVMQIGNSISYAPGGKKK